MWIPVSENPYAATILYNTPEDAEETLERLRKVHPDLELKATYSYNQKYRIVGKRRIV